MPVGRKDDVIAGYGRRGGPLPRRGSGSIGAAFWRAYDLGPDQAGLRGGAPDSPAGRAFRAGLKRRRAEPGLDGSAQAE